MELGESFLPPVDRMDCRQLSQLYEAMFMVDVSDDTVIAALEKSCGAGSKYAKRRDILPVLQDIHNRCLLEENAYWDFRALVINDDQTLSPKDALLFLRVIHSDEFSTQLWEAFQKSRPDSTANVSWYEIKPWVCITREGTSDKDSIHKLEEEITAELEHKDKQQLQQYEDRNKTKKSMELSDHSQRMKKKAEDKVRVWESLGLAPFLHGEDDESLAGLKTMWVRKVEASDVMKMIEHKYKLLKHRLLKVMVRQFSGETTWEILPDSEKDELVEEVLAEERRLNNSGLLSEDISQLPGANITSTSNFSSLTALMDKIESSRGVSEGVNVTAKSYWSSVSGVRESYGQHIIELEDRLKKELQLYKTSSSVNTKTKGGCSNQNELYYCQLQRQMLLIESNADLSEAALAVGLAERSSIEPFYEIDTARYEYLAYQQLSTNIRQHKHSMVVASSMTAADRNSLNRTDILTLIVKQIDEKMKAERMIMVKLLKHRSNKSAHSASSCLTKADVIRQLTMLSNKRASWRNASTDYQTMQKDEHTRILQQALSIYYDEEVTSKTAAGRSGGGQIINSAILAILHLKQGQLFDKLIDQLAKNQKTVLLEMLKAEENATQYEYCDTIAAMLFGGVACGESDAQYVEALKKKYQALAILLMSYSLSKKYDDSWYSRPEEDQNRHIAKLNSLREQNKIDELDVQVSEYVKSISIHQVLGEDRLKFEKRITSQQPHCAEDTPKEGGVFSTLQNRYYSEYAAILEHAHKSPSPEAQILLILVKTEAFIVDKLTDFRIAGYLVGLLERIGGVLEKRHDEDTIRLSSLALCIVINHRLMWKIHGKLPKPESEIRCNDNSSESLWIECLVKETLLRQHDERYTMLTILLDDGLRELKDVADLQTKEEQHKRLVALQNKQRWLSFDSPDARDENIGILEEAAAIQMCLLEQSLVEESKPSEVDDIASLLIEKLLHMQEKQLALLLKNIQQGMSKDELMKLHTEETESRRTEIHRNVAKVLTSYTGLWSDELIMSEIDSKYTLLESQMLDSVLRDIYSGWDQKSPADKTQLTQDLRDKTQQLRVAGNVQALVQLYNSVFSDSETFFQLFGENSFEFAHRIVDYQNLENLPDEIYSAKEELIPVIDPLNALSDRKEEEKQSYQNLLRGMYEVHLGEQGRSAEVVKLRHHQVLIKGTDNFKLTATKLGLRERSQLVTHMTSANGDHRLMSSTDWTRILNLFQLSRTYQSEDSTQLNLSDVSDPSANDIVDIFKLHLSRHKQEVTKLGHMISNLDKSVLDSATVQPFDEKLQRLGSMKPVDGSHSKETGTVWSDVQLNEACALKLKLWEEMGQKYTPNNFLLAELEEKQIFELSRVIHMFSHKTYHELEKYIQSFNAQYYASLYAALCDTSHFSMSVTEQISQAIENKYDALKDKLLLEALMNQAGEAEWSRLSEAERQRRLMELKLKERVLREQGRHDDAAHLISEYLKDCEAVQQLIGDEKEEYERRLKERLERRRRRVEEEGMSAEEADKLERDEAADDEKMMETAQNDIIKHLDDKWQKEVEGLMNNLENMKDAAARDQKQQEELARVRREQRQIKREDQLGAAAALMKIADGQIRDAEEARRLQEQLVRERLAARRNKASDNKVKDDEVVMPESDDIIPLREAVIAELELKHQDEREFLLRTAESAPQLPYYSQSTSSDKTGLEVKITDLYEQRRLLREAAFFDSQEQAEVLQEGVCYKLRWAELSLQSDGKAHSNDDVIVSLMADLQQQQDNEMDSVKKDLEHKLAKSLREFKTLQNVARKNRWYDNVSAVVLTIEDISSLLDPEQEVLTALNQKYATLKDKLILEGLMNQMGEADWRRLSEKERQKKLMEIKMKERRLKDEGKLDEAKELLKGLIDAEQGIDSMKEDQERMLRERLEKLKSKLESNPPADAADKEKLEQEVEQVEEKLKRTSVLDNLEYELESEKDRLLALLKSQQDSSIADRMKQLELAKLRREKRLLKREGELDEASALIHLARKNEENRLAGLGSDKEMQLELARRRLAAKRERMAADRNTPEPVKSMDSTVKVQDRVLDALEKKHGTEMGILMKLASKADEEDYVEQGLYINNVKLRKALEELEAQCKGIQQLCKSGSANSTKDKEDLQKIFSRAFLYHLIVCIRAKYGDQGTDYTPEQVREVCAEILASLQEKQDGETNSASELMISEDDSKLESLVEAYHSATERGLYDNLIASLFGILDDETKWTGQENLSKLDEKFEKEKQELLEKLESGEDTIEKDGRDVDVEEMLRKLEAEHAAQKQAQLLQMERQNEMIKARRKSRKQARFEESANVARQLLEEAEANKASHTQAHQDTKNKQEDLMRERLAKRRADRAKQEELEQQAAKHLRPKSGAGDLFGKAMQMIPPIMGMKRERTVVNISDEQKQNQLKKLFQEKTTAEKNMSDEQKRQEELMKKRREERQSRKASQVEQIFSMGERQKTMFERSSSENRERQLTQVKDRIARIQYEKTVKPSSARKSTAFEQLVDTAQSKDEQMKALAANLQKRFATESHEVKEGKAKLKIGADESDEPATPAKILTAEEKQRILKERRLAKRKNKSQPDAAAPQLAPDEV